MLRQVYSPLFKTFPYRKVQNSEITADTIDLDQRELYSHTPMVRHVSLEGT